MITVALIGIVHIDEINLGSILHAASLLLDGIVYQTVHTG